VAEGEGREGRRGGGLGRGRIEQGREGKRKGREVYWEGIRTFLN
jgi:hypothetical protein